MSSRARDSPRATDWPAWAMVHGLSHLMNDKKVVPGEGELPGEEELVDTVLRMIDWSLSGLRGRSSD